MLREFEAELADADWCDFAAERERQDDRLLDLLAGRNVLVYRFEIPADLQPPQDGTRIYTLRSDRLSG